MVEDRHHGDQYYRNHHEREIFFHDSQVAEIVAREHEDCRPEDAAGNIVGEKTRVFHPAQPCDEGHEGPDDGYEPRQDNGLAAVFFVEFMRTVQVLPVEEPDVLLVEYLRPHEVAYPVVHVVADDCGGGEQHDQQRNIKGPDGRQRARREEQGIPRQEGRHHEPGFAEDDDEQDHVRPDAERLDYKVKVFIHMEDNIHECHQ